MEILIHDLRYALRLLLRNPGFTGAAVLALALGIGANTAIFSVVNSVLLQPLPYVEPDRLTLIWTRFEPDLPQNWVSGPELIDFRERSSSFEEFAALSWPSLSLTGSGEPEQVQAGAVTANLFPMLGVSPVIGRTFSEEESAPGTGNFTLLSHGYWQRRFGSDHTVIGQTILLNGQAATILGVMPPGFGILPPDAQSPTDVDLWVPLAVDFAQLNRGNHGFRVIARLRPGVTLAQAQVEMDGVAEQLDREFYQNTDFGITVVPLLGHVVRSVRPALLVLLGAVGFVLLIACANVASLQLARAISREREISIRAALGAGRRRLVRQLLTESIVLAILSGALGLLVAVLGLDLLIALAPADIPRLATLQVDGPVLGFTLAVSVLTGVLFGLIPAVQASRPDLTESLKEGGRGATQGARGRRARSFLVVGEVAIALILLAGAGLMIRSFAQLQGVDPGFNPSGLITARLILPQSRYPETADVVSFYRQVIERVKTLPGVDVVGTVSHLPLSGAYTSGTITVDNPAASQDTASFEADRRAISPDYFRAMQIPLVNGRYFTDLDTAESQGVVVVDEKLAQRFWPNEDPIGKRIKLGGGQSTAPWLSIVGVVKPVRHYSLDSEGREMVYFPYGQLIFAARSMFLTIRSAHDLAPVAAGLRREVHAVNPNQPIFLIRNMEELVYTSVARQRFSMLLLAVFAAVAIILASVGIYGVINYSVTQRTHEIGVRVALGAKKSDIVRLVIAHGFGLVLAGILIGLVGSFLLTRLMQSLLFGVSATDPATLSVVSLILVWVALVASYLPARKASRVDPMTALRYE